VNGADVLRDFMSDLMEAVVGGTPIEAPALRANIPQIDERIGGMVPYFWLIGADTSGGKTALSLQLVRAILSQGGRVLVFALEMRARQLIRRIVSAEGRIPIQRLMRPETLNEYDTGKLSGPGASWNAGGLLICDDPDVTIQEVRAIARAQHAVDPLACVLVDYIQLASAGRFRDGANREQEISFIGSQCVKMAKELGVPVIAPTQLNDDGKVRESRALKHHAAVYLVIEQDQILCSKNRDGERDWSIPWTLTGDIQTFEPR
jgi:replicative DNA helicase